MCTKISSDQQGLLPKTTNFMNLGGSQNLASIF
jgi:hypothetical protein